MKTILATIVLGLASTTAALAGSGVYMGRASTGEAVYYHGARAQCGNLPSNHECWKNPAASYTIGRDQVFAIPDCKRRIFKEVWVGDRLVARNMRPQSKAISLVLETACNSAR